jgi:hypothetical protein
MIGPKKEELQGILLKEKIGKMRIIHGEHTFIPYLKVAVR